MIWAIQTLCGRSGASGDAPAPVVVAFYNLENYQIAASIAGGGAAKAKSEESREAAADIIANARPDILGVCEMGSRESAFDLQKRLQARGIGLSSIEYVEGPDPDRHLALLTRFDALETHSQARVSFILEGRPQLVRRGFLEVVLEPAKGYRLRLLGAHLKSRLAVSEGDSLVRRIEAELLRKRIDEILSQNPDENLLVYGDMNDTKDQMCIQTILGLRGGSASLTDLQGRDCVGDHWTHFWKTGDVYSRIDYLLASRGLVTEVTPHRTVIDRSTRWRAASDHRLISTEIVPREKGTRAGRDRPAHSP